MMSKIVYASAISIILATLCESAPNTLGFFGEIHGEGSPGVALGFPAPDLHEPDIPGLIHDHPLAPIHGKEFFLFFILIAICKVKRA